MDFHCEIKVFISIVHGLMVHGFIVILNMECQQSQHSNLAQT